MPIDKSKMKPEIQAAFNEIFGGWCDPHHIGYYYSLLGDPKYLRLHKPGAAEAIETEIRKAVAAKRQGKRLTLAFWKDGFKENVEPLIYNWSDVGGYPREDPQ